MEVALFSCRSDSALLILIKILAAAFIQEFCKHLFLVRTLSLYLSNYRFIFTYEDYVHMHRLQLSRNLRDSPG